MDLKFYLNKFAKVDNIEEYTLSTVRQLESIYSDYLENTEGKDPDFPMMTLGGHGEGGGKKVKGRNAAQVREEIGENPGDNNSWENEN